MLIFTLEAGCRRKKEFDELPFVPSCIVAIFYCEAGINKSFGLSFLPQRHQDTKEKHNSSNYS